MHHRFRKTAGLAIATVSIGWLFAPLDYAQAASHQQKVECVGSYQIPFWGGPPAPRPPIAGNLRFINNDEKNVQKSPIMPTQRIYYQYVVSETPLTYGAKKHTTATHKVSFGEHQDFPITGIPLKCHAYFMTIS
jgi:hypothetical protein